MQAGYRESDMEHAPSLIANSRIVLRDFRFEDRSAFVEYQMDPRYRSLYDIDEDGTHACDLFEMFQGWQDEKPRRNLQLGIFDAVTNRLCGCAGLRIDPAEQGAAVFGIELAPSEWGRFRIALDVTACLIELGFSRYGLERIVGDAASGNERVTKLARWFGAEITARRDGPDWMRVRGWQQVDWSLTRESWARSDERARWRGDRTRSAHA